MVQIDVSNKTITILGEIDSEYLLSILSIDNHKGFKVIPNGRWYNPIQNPITPPGIWGPFDITCCTN